MRRITIAATLMLLLSSTTHAEDKKTYLPTEVKPAEVRYDGWDGSLILGASMSLAQNSNMVGVTDGIGWAMGLLLKGNLGYIHGQHEWANIYNLSETYAYTSSLGDFVKTVDDLSWKSTYLYYLKRIPWLGPFGEFKLHTTMLPGHDVQSESYTYQVTRLDGTVGPGTTNTKFRLSDPFSPMFLEESIGAFARPLNKPAIVLEAKLGFGAKHILAAGQFSVDKVDKDTKLITIKELDDVHQGGPALSVGAKGSLADKKVTYNALAEVMFPVLNNQSEGDDRNAAELANVLMEAGLSFKLVSWASLDYTFRAVREPQLIDKWQVQNNLLLSFTYTLVKSRVPAKK